MLMIVLYIRRVHFQHNGFELSGIRLVVARLHGVRSAWSSRNDTELTKNTVNTFHLKSCQVLSTLCQVHHHLDLIFLLGSLQLVSLLSSRVVEHQSTLVYQVLNNKPKQRCRSFRWVVSDITVPTYFRSGFL